VKLFRLIVVVVIVALLATGVYYVREINTSERQIAATSTHEAYCNQLTNAGYLYLANPNVTESELNPARSLFQSVLSSGVSGTKLLSVAQVYAEVLRVRNGSVTIEGWDNWSREVIAVYQDANNC
jgi:hypothetical protein